MISAVTLIDDLRGRGVELAVAGERLHWRAPRGAMTPGLVDALRQHKAEMLQHLAAPKVGSVRGARAPETADLIDWFLNTPPPAAPFELERGVFISHPDRYWKYLRGDIAAGPGRGRSYYGGFEANLRRLYQLFGPGDIVPGGQTEELD